MLLCRLEITERPAAAELENPNALELTESLSRRAQVVAQNLQRKEGCGHCNDQKSQRGNQNSIMHRDLWHWVVDHGVQEVK